MILHGADFDTFPRCLDYVPGGEKDLQPGLPKKRYSYFILNDFRKEGKEIFEI